MIAARADTARGVTGPTVMVPAATVRAPKAHEVRAVARGDMPPAPQFDTVAANQRLTQAGYSAFGLMRQEGPRVLLDATNPDGETVTLELDPQGQLVRETAR